MTEETWYASKKWHEVIFLNRSLESRQEILDWIEKRIDGHEKHVIWYHIDPVEKYAWPTLIVKFRYERDLIFCKLRWL